MALPKAVEDAAKKADEMLLQMQTAEEPKNTEEALGIKATEASKEEPAPGGDKTEEGKGEEPKQPPKPVTPEEYERLVHAHSVLQGKYDAEVPRLHAKIRELEAKLAAGETTARPPAGEKPKDLDDVLEKLANDYGEEFAGMVQSAIDQKVSRAISTIRADVDEVKSTFAKTKEEKFLEELTGLVENWREIFKDPGFSDYLDGYDDFSGLQLRQMAVEANNAMDAKRLAKFYKAYQSGKKGGSGAPAKTEVKDKRESLIVPSSSGKGASGGSGEKPDYIKADDVQRFYNDVTRGVYSYRPKEKEAMEAKINHAIANNWIIP